MVKLTISVDEQETDGYLRRAARAMSTRYRLPGFRPGKAPYNVVVRRLGIESVQAQVLDQFGDEIYQKGLQESALDPADQASLNDVTWDPTLALHLTLPVSPEAKLGDYLEVRVPWEEPQVTDEALQEALEKLQKDQREWTATEERPAQLGDQVVLDIKGTVDEQVVLDNVGRELILNAESPYPIPGFAQQVAGMSAGEEREFDLPYPPDHYNTDIAGKAGHFKVTLGEVRAESLPDLDDEFAMSVGDYENLDDLKVQLTDKLLQEATEEAEDAYEEAMWVKLLETATVEYPDVAVERELDSIEKQLESQLRQQNLDLDTYWQLTNTTKESWREKTRGQAEERLKRNMILSEVIREHKLQVSQEEMDAHIESTTEGMGEHADEVREFLKSPNGQLSVLDTLVVRKALATLKTIARGEYVEAAEEAATDAEAEGKAPEAEAEAIEAAPEEQPAAETEAEAEAGECEEACTLTPPAAAASAEPAEESAEAAPAE